MRNKILFLGLVGLIGCMSEIKTVETMDNDGLIVKNHSWGNYHWSDSDLNPTVGDNTKSAMWTGETAFYTDHWTSIGTPIQPVFSNKRRVKVSVVEGYSDQWLGLAQIWIKNGHISEGKVSLNTTLLSESRFTRSAALHVLCQELGHVWGLDHNRVDLNTCMNDCLTAATYDEWLTCLNNPSAELTNQHDAEQLNLIYSHADEESSSSGPNCDMFNNHPKCPSGTPGNMGTWIDVHSTPVWGIKGDHHE